MQIIDYQYLTGSISDHRQVRIPELTRDTAATPQFIELTGLKVELTCPTAFICIESAPVHQSEAGLGLGNGKYQAGLKGLSPYVAHQWASTFKNKEFLVSMEVTNGTCASAIQAIYRAHQIIESNEAKEVVIIGHERISPDTLRMFKECGIPILCGDGFVYMKLGVGHVISKPSWYWTYNANPFMFTRTDLEKLVPYYKVGYVKLHGTGTPSNEAAERSLELLATPLRYKHIIGHTQGISALLETCLVLDDPTIRGRILVVANGLGGYYGSFTLTKPNART